MQLGEGVVWPAGSRVIDIETVMQSREKNRDNLHHRIHSKNKQTNKTSKNKNGNELDLCSLGKVSYGLPAQE